MKRLHIVAAIILNPDQNKVFITKRHKEAHKGGLWEFPGGKVEPGESAEEGMVRELHEEIGIDVTALEHFEHMEFDYSDKSLKFDFFVVSEFDNAPYGREGQESAWVEIASLEHYEFPEANLPIMNKIREIYS